MSRRDGEVGIHLSFVFIPDLQILTNMSLRDLACYTLNIQPSSTDPNIVELVEVEGVKREPRYARVKEPSVGPGENYTAGIYGEAQSS